MKSASVEFHRLVAENSKTLFKATMTLNDGTTLELTGDDVMMGGATYTDSVSSNSSFDIGAAVINTCELTLNNYDRKFDQYDFDGAVIVPYTGVELSGGRHVEWILRGHYIVDQPDAYGATIGLTALDYMCKLERPYSDVSTTYPATLQTIVNDICVKCGVTLANPDFANRAYVVDKRPDDDSMTCLAMMAYAAQASGSWARCDAYGRVRLDWYDTSIFASSGLDGGVFDGASPYATGDAADGGYFHGGGANVDGGAFAAPAYAYVHALQDVTICTDDVVITGVRVTSQGGSDSQDSETRLYGNEGYVLELSGNPLIQYGKAAAVAKQVGERVVGMKFRPFSVSALGDPCYEAGDPILVVDERQNVYESYITTLTWETGGYEKIACNAESPGRNRASTYSALTRAFIESQNAVKREKSAREAAQETLALMLAGASGLYKTSEVQSDGSTVHYLHDKPMLAQSQTVWKATADAFGVSTDGGKTYSYGVDSNGVAILNQIYAVGIDADYINTGTFQVRAGDTITFSADADTGAVLIQDSNGNLWNTRTGELRMASTSTVGGKTVEQIAAEKAAAAKSASDKALADALELVNRDLGSLQDQVDGNITTWFYAADPSLSRPPVTSDGTPGTGWTTTDAKDEHLGDLYYNTDTGHAWRWMVASGTYSWSRITDTDVTKALADAAKAQDTADGKRRVFTSTPAPPYDVGDLWTQGASGDILTCTTARASGSYVASDWSRSSKYTDDSRAVAAEDNAKAYAKTYADSAVDALDAMLAQQEILDRLTEDGTAEGIYLSNGQLYINGSYIKTGTLNADLLTTGRLIVYDAAKNVLFDANIGSRSVTMAGFTAKNGALYRGLSTLYGSAESGVYVGTDGLAMRTSSGNVTRITPGNGLFSESTRYHMDIAGGVLSAWHTGVGDADAENKGGYIDASAAVNPSGIWSAKKHGVRIHGDEVLAIDAPDIVMSADNGSTWRYLDGAKRRLLEASKLSKADNLVTLSAETETVQTLNGMEVAITGTPPVELAVDCTGDQRLATKAYVDGAVPSLSGYATQSWVTGRGYATQSWVQGQGYASSSGVTYNGADVSDVDFSVSGTTLTITLS